MDSSHKSPLFLKQNGNYYSYGFDLNKNVTELFNEQGEIISQYDYAPYGQILDQTETISNPLKWSSEVDDPETGLTYYNYRHYNPADGRWISKDPIGEKDDFNLYRFIKNKSNFNFDKLGKAAAAVIAIPLIPAIVLTEAFALTILVATTICSLNDDCRKTVTSFLATQIIAAAYLAKKIYDTACKIRCRIVNHPPHHYFQALHLFPPYPTTCYMNHIQMNCYLAGTSSSGFLEVRIPYGTCHKNRMGIPPSSSYAIPVPPVVVNIL